MILLFLGLSDYMLLKENYRVEYPLMFFLIFISGIGLLLSNDIISILICLECITFSGYILVGFDKTRRLSAAAGIRYLILGSIPSAFLVIGLAFLYSNFGIFSKDALELISSSFLEPSIFLKDKFNNLDNLLKYNFIGNNEKIIYKTISDGKDNAKFYIDFG
jgi:NADH:ubiquinone oxidoreductase subunit 2 (subunit N)